MSKTLSHSDSFRPSPAMSVWLDTALELMTLNVTVIAEKCQISRQSWYHWMKNGQFRSWFRAQWDERISGWAWKLDVIGFEKAESDFRYWEAMQRRTGSLLGKLEEQPQDIVVTITDTGKSPIKEAL